MGREEANNCSVTHHAPCSSLSILLANNCSVTHHEPAPRLPRTPHYRSFWRTIVPELLIGETPNGKSRDRDLFDASKAEAESTGFIDLFLMFWSGLFVLCFVFLTVKSRVYNSIRQ